MSDLKLCYETMTSKADELDRRWRYYDGNQPLAFTNTKLREVIRNGAVFTQNFCSVVVDTTRNRLSIQSWDYPDEQAMDRIDALWKTVLKRTMNEAHLSFLVTGEGFIIVWPDDSGKPKAFYHSPEQVNVIYKEDDPYTPRLACKRWMDASETDKKWRLNLYYPDHIEHYVSRTMPQSDAAYTLEDEETNQYGDIPVFRFALSTRSTAGDLTLGVLNLQDSLNKLLNDMMVAAEFTAFPQRWAIGMFSNTDQLPISPASFLKVPPSAQGEQPASVGAFPTGDPRNYLAPMENITQSMSVMSATPKHYFTGQGGDPSGEALRAMEAPLVAKVERYQEQLTEAWKKAMVFAGRIDGVALDIEQLDIIWQNPHTIQPNTQASTRLTNSQAGIPIKTQLRDEGWTEEQLAQMQEDASTQAVIKAREQGKSALPPTAEQMQPAFQAMVQTPDIAGEVVRAGILQRAIDQRTN